MILVRYFCLMTRASDRQASLKEHDAPDFVVRVLLGLYGAAVDGADEETYRLSLDKISLFEAIQILESHPVSVPASPSSTFFKREQRLIHQCSHIPCCYFIRHLSGLQ